MMGRVIVGITLVVVMVGALFLGKWWTSMMFGVIAIISLSEYSMLSSILLNRKSDIKTALFVLFGTTIYILLIGMIAFYGDLTELTERFLPSLIILSCAYFILRILNLYIGWKHDKLKEFLDIIMYIPVPLALCLWICTSEGGFMPNILLGILVLVWAGDVGAYYLGRAIGKTKLFERISPNKTWEGAFGGLVFCLLASNILSVVSFDLSKTEWMILAVIVWIFGIYGDLIESQYKRLTGVKDSSAALGAHGGFLDRFDGFFCAIPFSALFLLYIN